MFKKWLTWPLALLCVLAHAQTVTPIVQPHQTFFDTSGAACSLCTLSSFAAGTTTPQPTYTDSSGGPQNPNPLTLDIAGGANIWVSNSLAYKFVLKSPLGVMIWTVDNVKASGGGAVPCATPFAIQFANSSATALACDPTIVIDPTGHAIQIGGPITGASFTMKNLSAILSSWTFDVSSPTTALNSFGAIPLTNLAAQAPGTIVMNDATTAQIPTAFPLPPGCTQGINWDSSTRIWSCVFANTNIPLSNLATQAPDTVVMNASPSTTQPTAVGMPTGCAFGDNYDTSTHTWTCVTNTAYNPTDHDVTFSRSFGTVYQNTSGGAMRIYGYGSTSGSSVGSVQVLIGSVSPSSPTNATTCAATVSGGACGFVGEVPNGWFYTVAANTLAGGNHAVSGVASWHEVF